MIISVIMFVIIIMFIVIIMMIIMMSIIIIISILTITIIIIIIISSSIIRMIVIIIIAVSIRSATSAARWGNALTDLQRVASVFSRGLLRTSFLMASSRGQMKKGGSLPDSRVAEQFS